MPALSTFNRASIRVKLQKGRTPNDIWGYEAASQTYKPMDFLIDSSGSLAIGCATNASIATSSTIIGLADSAASGTTAARAPFIPVDEDVLVRLPVYHGTPASATTAVTQIGSTFNLFRSTANAWFCDISSTTAPYFTVVDIDKEAYPVGETYGYVWGFIKSAARRMA